ncbi:MAG: ribosomal protein S18-alanine N-acetyltransferase [Bariatricus sp.]|nr:ribosomal protein S18-alanine N-acetyltransferase [Bariatricus sp.]
MPENIVLKELSEEDTKEILEIARLEKAIFSDSWSEAEVRSTVKQEHTFCVAAKWKEEVLGYFLCYYVLDECEIARIAVANEARRNGIGQFLFEEMLDICHRKELQRILLDVRKSNENAIRFYKKNGFLIDGIRKNYYGGKDPEDAVLMSRSMTLS